MGSVMNTAWTIAIAGSCYSVPKSGCIENDAAALNDKLSADGAPATAKADGDGIVVTLDPPNTLMIPAEFHERLVAEINERDRKRWRVAETSPHRRPIGAALSRRLARGRGR